MLTNPIPTTNNFGIHFTPSLMLIATSISTRECIETTLLKNISLSGTSEKKKKKLSKTIHKYEHIQSFKIGLRFISDMMTVYLVCTFNNNAFIRSTFNNNAFIRRITVRSKLMFPVSYGLIPTVNIN